MAGALFAAENAGMSPANSIPIISPNPRTWLMTRGYFAASARQFRLEEFPRLAGVVRQMFALDHFQHFQSHRARQRRAAESRAVRPGAQQVRLRLPHPKCPHGKSAAQRLGHGDSVRQKPGGAAGLTASSKIR